MRLYDMIMESPGTIIDQGFHGAFTHLARRLRDAQCFMMSSDVSEACQEVCLSRPSSILSGQSQLRAPYPHIWIEWLPSERDKGARLNDKPKPNRMGCYLHSNPAGDKGTAIYVWHHKNMTDLSERYNFHEITIDPFGIIFDWSGTSTTEPAMVQYARSVGLSVSDELLKKKYTEDRESFRKNLLQSDKWKNFAGNDKELEAYIELEKTTGIIPLDICRGMFESPTLGEQLKPGVKMYEDFMEDLSGEFSFTEAFLLMLNSRSKIMDQTREDLSRLNKSRAKRHRLPLKEFIVTNLRLTKTQQNRADAAGMDREAARRHLVRGHFKVRSSGVYWYTAHMRGYGRNSPVARREYTVRL